MYLAQKNFLSILDFDGFCRSIIQGDFCESEGICEGNYPENRRCFEGGTVSELQNAKELSSAQTSLCALKDCAAGDEAVIERVDMEEKYVFRLFELGLRKGMRIRISQRANFGGRVVARGQERIALDGKTAAAIRVRKL